MRTKKKNALLNSSISHLARENDWSKLIVRTMIIHCLPWHPCCRCKDFQGCEIRLADPPNRQRKKKESRQKCLADQLLLSQVMTALEQEYKKALSFDYWKSNKVLLEKISGLGFTRLDFIFLPQKTISIEILKKASKKRIKMLDARLLGTISERSAHKQRSASDITRASLAKTTPATIGDLLAGGANDLIRSKTTEEKTRQILTTLGFTEEDGPFMESQNGRYESSADPTPIMAADAPAQLSLA